MKSTSVVIGLLTGCIIAGACGYFDRSGIDSAPAASFIWVHSFHLQVYGPLVLPMLAVFIICACEAVGDITATCDVSKIEVEGKIYESRVQGGVLADGCNGILAALCTITPMTTFAQNNGVIALTRCANRTAGYCCWYVEPPSPRPCFSSNPANPPRRQHIPHYHGCLCQIRREPGRHSRPCHRRNDNGGD